MEVKVDLGQGKMVVVNDEEIIVAARDSYVELSLEEIFGLIESGRHGYLLAEVLETEVE